MESPAKERNETVMSDSARHVLNVVALRENLPLGGWEHYFSGMSDDGVSTFHFDRAPEDGAGWLKVIVDADGMRVDWTESKHPELAPNIAPPRTLAGVPGSTLDPSADR